MFGSLHTKLLRLMLCKRFIRLALLETRVKLFSSCAACLALHGANLLVPLTVAPPCYLLPPHSSADVDHRAPRTSTACIRPSLAASSNPSCTATARRVDHRQFKSSNAYKKRRPPPRRWRRQGLDTDRRIEAEAGHWGVHPVEKPQP
jgi:hypothetical protein